MTLALLAGFYAFCLAWAYALGYRYITRPARADVVYRLYDLLGRPAELVRAACRSRAERGNVGTVAGK